MCDLKKLAECLGMDLDELEKKLENCGYEKEEEWRIEITDRPLWAVSV